MILPGESAYKPNKKMRLPYTNGIVTGEVEYVCYNHVVVKILEVDGVPSIPVQGVVHREDSMYGIKDNDKLNELFSPGDIIHGRVLSLGDTGPLVISTADESHGVFKAVDFKTQKEIKMANGKFLHNGKTLKRKTAHL